MSQQSEGIVIDETVPPTQDNDYKRYIRQRIGWHKMGMRNNQYLEKFDQNQLLEIELFIMSL